MDYTTLENDFGCACDEVIVTLKEQYKNNYQAGGPGKLEAFFALIKSEFENAESKFIDTKKLSGDPEALKRIRAIAKKHAKRCVEDYGKIY
ncbi:MAG: hypothetical protein V4581_02870 [Bacteroidota bacterium]